MLTENPAIQKTVRPICEATLAELTRGECSALAYALENAAEKLREYARHRVGAHSALTALLLAEVGQACVAVSGEGWEDECGCSLPVAVA